MTIQECWLMLLLCVVCAHCGTNGYDTEDRFVARGNEEKRAIEYMRAWVHRSVPLLNRADVAESDKVRLRRAIEATRVALDDYGRLRDRGATQVYIMAGVRTSAAGILADDVTGVGTANDVLLIPLALAAIATHVITDAQASTAELGRSWNRVLARIGELGTTVDDILLLAAAGNVADTGIMAEVYELIRKHRWDPNKDEDKCRALAALLQAAAQADDTRRVKRIQTTQKAYRCRGSRHSRE